jgi:hypothetical protein
MTEEGGRELVRRRMEKEREVVRKRKEGEESGRRRIERKEGERQ